MRLRRTTICLEGWYYLLVLAMVGAGAMLGEINLLLVLAGMLAGPVLFGWRSSVRATDGLEVRRKAPQGICAGDLLVTNVRLSNLRRRRGGWALVVEEEIRRESGPSSPGERAAGGKAAGEEPIRPRVLFPYVAAGESRIGVYRGRLARRGRYRLGPLRLSTRFPFGLFCRSITLDEIETLTVFPRLGQLTRAWAARRQEAFAGEHRRERHQGADGDFYGVREWRVGDSRRWIHWRTSARLGRPVVRQFEQPRHRDLAVLVDLWQPPSPGESDLENVELAVSFAATVVADLCRKGGSNLHLGAGGLSPQWITGPASAALLQEAMQGLALAEACSKDGLAVLLLQAFGRVAAGTEIVLITTRAVDLADRSRFAAIWADPARRSAAARMQCIDASSEELTRFFRPD